MPTRTTILLDEPSRRAAKVLAAKLDVSPSEAIRRALVHYREHVLGVPPDVRRRRVNALSQLAELFRGNDPAAEVKRLEDEDPYF
jgi:hypothetical protein